MFYHIIKTDGASVALVENIRFIRENPDSGAFVEADELTAQGVVVNGIPYSLAGRAPLSGVADTVSIDTLTEAQAEQTRAKVERDREITANKALLSNTDYIVLKIAEAVADGDTDEVAQLQALYAPELAQRKQARARINDLQAEEDLAEE